MHRHTSLPCMVDLPCLGTTERLGAINPHKTAASYRIFTAAPFGRRRLPEGSLIELHIYETPSGAGYANSVEMATNPGRLATRSNGTIGDGLRWDNEPLTLPMGTRVCCRQAVEGSTRTAPPGIPGRAVRVGMCQPAALRVRCSRLNARRPRRSRL